MSTKLGYMISFLSKPRSILILFVALTITGIGILFMPKFSQRIDKSDSHEYLLQKEKVMKLYKKVDTLISESDVRIENIEESKKKVSAAISISQNINWEYGEMLGWIRSSRLALRENQYDQAFNYGIRVIYSNTNKTTEDNAIIWNVMGNTLDKMGLNNLAIIYYKKLLWKFENDDHKTAYYSCGNIAINYMEARQYDSCNYYNGLAITLAKKTNSPATLMRAYNDAGWGYHVQGDIAQALELYDQGIKTYQKSEATGWRGSLLLGMLHRNIAISYIEMRDFQSANREINLSDIIFNANSNEMHFPRNQLLMVEIQFGLNRNLSAKKLLDSVQKIISTPSDRIHYYSLLIDYHGKTRNIAEMDQALRVYLKLSEQEQRTKLTRISKSSEEMVKLNTHIAQKELKTQRNLNKKKDELYDSSLHKYIIIITCIIIVALTFFIKNNSDKRKKQRLMLARNEVNSKNIELEISKRKIIEKELKFKEKDLVNFAVFLSQKNEFIKEVENYIVRIQKEDGNDSHTLHNLMVYLKSQKQTDTRLTLFHENVDTINHEFIEQLEEKFPNLSPGEIELCALLRIQLSSKEIASVRNISVTSVKTFRNRLRKKLGLDSSLNLTKYFRDFV